MSADEQQRDAKLVEAMARGDRAALAALYEHHAPRLLTLLRHLMGQRAEAQDVLHDVFLEAWRRAGDYSEERGSVSVWLSLRARSRALDRLRSAHQTRTRGFSEELLRQLSDPQADPTRSTDHGKLAHVLGALAHEEQEVIVLGYFGGLSSSEIAARLQIPTGTVKSRTRSALNKLRATLTEEPT
jgi:RNA polymerase sigma-70 factor (ECF subfamily)